MTHSPLPHSTSSPPPPYSTSPLSPKNTDFRDNQKICLTSTSYVACQTRVEAVFRPWKPLVFNSDGFVLLSADKKVEEETLPD
jgi:hypothetical protein